MSTSPIENADSVKGSRAWLEDDRNTTEEAEAVHWDAVKKGSDELLEYYWTNYGKWAYFSFASACLIFGGIAGYKKGQDKEMIGVPVTKSVKTMALKALAAGTVLCASVSAITAGAIIHYYDFKSVDDFQTRMRKYVPSLTSPVPRVFEKVGMKRKEADTHSVTEFEVESLDETMNQAFGKSDYYAEFKPEDYKHQADEEKL